MVGGRAFPSQAKLDAALGVTFFNWAMHFVFGHWAP